MNKPKNVLKTLLRVLLGVLITLVVLAGCMAAFVLVGKEKTLNLAHGGVTPLSVSDGTYTGRYSGFRWSNTVEVTVQNHEMITIRQTKPQVFAKEETIQTLVDRVLAAQSTDVDAVSGATADSNAFFAALEDALTP